MKTVYSLRDVRLADTSGHVAFVRAETPTQITDELLREAFTRGCVEYDPEKHGKDKPAPEPGPNPRKELKAALEQIYRAGNEEDFTSGGNGYPRVAVVSEILGYQVGAEKIAEISEIVKAELAVE